MAFAPIALIIPQYDKTTYANWWLKAYEQGTTTPLSMATDVTGATLLAKAELDTEGFPETAGNARFIPFINGDYDLWLFPTAAEADANDTSNAIQFADDLNADPLANITAGQMELWLSPTTYNIPDVVAGSDDNYYRSLADGNQGNDPTLSPGFWELLQWGRAYNSAITYGLIDSAYGSDGFLYISIAAGNLGNDPTTSPTKWRPGTRHAQYGTVGGTADAITVTFPIPITAWVDGFEFRIRAAGANTITNPTVDADAIGAKTIVMLGNSALSVGSIGGADHELIVRYNSSNDNVELLNPKELTDGAIDDIKYNFGDGSDGAKTVVGSETLSSGVYNYTDLDIPIGTTLSPTESSLAYLILRCSGTLTIAGSLTADEQGADGSPNFAAGVGDDGYLGGSGGGGTSNSGTPGTDGGATLKTPGGAGTASPGPGGPGSAMAASLVAYLLDGILKADIPYGGAGGGASLTNAAGGDGGGIIIIFAKEVIFTGTVSADGGAGAVITAGAGGGGGGVVVIHTPTWTTDTGAISVAGGLGGNGTQDGGDGGAGISSKITL